MAGSVSGYDVLNPWQPAGYQAPAAGPGIINKDQERQTGAPAGYKWDPVQQKYIRTPASIGEDQGAAMNGLNKTLGTSSSATGGYAGGGMPNFGAAASAGTSTPANFARVSMTPTMGTVGSPTMPSTIQGNSSANVAPIKGPDTHEADAAAFASAKDQIGQTSRGALSGLAGAMAGRGIVGSGVEGRGMANVINQGQQQLGETSRGLAVKNADLAQQNALATYQGDIAQRGQSLANDQANTGFGVAQRGQDISALENAMNSLVAQRGQDINQRSTEFQGGITQRGQDLGFAQNASALAQQRQLEQQRIIQQALAGLQY